MLNVPPPTRVAIGTVEIAGKRFEVFASTEWARYFQQLNTQTVANTEGLAASQPHAMLQNDAAEAPDVFPGPPGPPGGKGDPGLALFLLQDAPEAPDAIPGPPGPPGRQGDSGMALFMLQDDARDDQPLVPPCADGVYVPLNSKDATGGVPGLTQFKLNLKNVAGTITSWFTTAATVARTWTMPDKDGTVAVLSDFAAPPAIGTTTPAAGKFTSIDATGITVGSGIAGAGVTMNGNNSGAAGGSALVALNGGAYVLAIGNKSAIVGGAYDATPYFYTNGGALTIHDAMKVQGAWACNGKTPQTPAASGGTLAGVIAALVANGILSS